MKDWSTAGGYKGLMDPGKGENSLFVLLQDSLCHYMLSNLVLVLRSWGVCFTYGIWFGLEAFACMGHTYKQE